MKWLALVVVVTACGRFGFDTREAGDDAVTGDAADLCSHTFCDNFQRNELMGRWDAIENSVGAGVALDAQAAGTPGSFLLSLPSPNLENGFLVKHFPSATTSVLIDVELSYTTATPGSAEIDLITLRWDDLPPPCTSFGYFLVRDGTGPLDLQETYQGCGGNEDMALLDIANSGFHHVVMEVTFGAVGMVKVDVDGVNKVTKPTSHAIAASPLTLRLGGAAVRNMAAPWQIRYDDLAVDLQ